MLRLDVVARASSLDQPTITVAPSPRTHKHDGINLFLTKSSEDVNIVGNSRRETIRSVSSRTGDKDTDSSSNPVQNQRTENDDSISRHKRPPSLDLQSDYCSPRLLTKSHSDKLLEQEKSLLLTRVSTSTKMRGNFSAQATPSFPAHRSGPDLAKPGSMKEAKNEQIVSRFNLERKREQAPEPTDDSDSPGLADVHRTRLRGYTDENSFHDDPKSGINHQVAHSRRHRAQHKRFPFHDRRSCSDKKYGSKINRRKSKIQQQLQNSGNSLNPGTYSYSSSSDQEDSFSHFSRMLTRDPGIQSFDKEKVRSTKSRVEAIRYEHPKKINNFESGSAGAMMSTMPPHRCASCS